MGLLDQVQLHYVDSIDAAAAMQQWLSEQADDVIAVDTETSGLDTYRGDRVRLVQLGDRRHGWAVPWEQWGGVAADLLNRWEGRYLFHNAMFDVANLENSGVRIPWARVEDTRTLAWVIDPTRATGLKPLADRYVDPRSSAMGAQLDTAMSAQGWTWATVPIDFPLYWQYGALDTVLTSHIWHHLIGRRDSQLTAAYELELAVLPVFEGMQRRGAAIDVEYAAARSAEFAEHVKVLDEWVMRYYGVRRGSDTQIVNLLLKMNVPLSKLTPGGAFCMDVEVKDWLIINGPPHVQELIRTVKLAGQLTKLRGAYLDHFVSDHRDGLLHASINPLGAPKTGRVSITQPGLQTLPRADGDNPAAIEVRNCFIPRRSGNKLIMVDLNQIELRLAAYNSQDPQLCALLNDSSVDPFNAMASAIFARVITKADRERTTTKNAAYATLYGAGTAKFSLTAGITEAEGGAFLDAYYRSFPGLRRLQEHVELVARQRLAEEGSAYVRTPFGHRLEARANKVYALLNYLIQGTAANLMKKMLVDMDSSGIGEFLVLPVHDEVIIDAPVGVIDEVGRIAARCMTDETGAWTVPITAGVDGPYDRWGMKYARG